MTYYGDSVEDVK